MSRRAGLGRAAGGPLHAAPRAAKHRRVGVLTAAGVAVIAGALGVGGVLLNGGLSSATPDSSVAQPLTGPPTAVALVGPTAGAGDAVRSDAVHSEAMDPAVVESAAVDSRPGRVEV